MLLAMSQGNNGSMCTMHADSTRSVFPKLAARLIGSKLEDDIVESVVNDAATEFDPGGDLHASPGYRRQLAAVLATRMLRAAYDGARKPS